MKKIITFIIILIAVALISTKALCAFIVIPGETPEEQAINGMLLENTDELEVLSYIDHDASSVRMVACMRLGDIGTYSVIPHLEQLALNTNEDREVIKHASFGIWKIRYKQELLAGGNGSSTTLEVFSEPPEATAIPLVKGWALKIMGDMGLEEALPIIESIIEDTNITPHSSYLKDEAQKAQKKIEFIIGFDPGTPIEIKIEQGLKSERDMCIRIWSLDRLLEQGYEDIIDLLKALLEEAESKGEWEFASIITVALDKELEKMRYPALEITYPKDEAIMKSSKITVAWKSYGEMHTEQFELKPGIENIFKKTVTDINGNPITRSITIFYENEPPTLHRPSDTVFIEPGKPFSMDIVASDPDDTYLVYFGSDMPEDAVVYCDTGELVWGNPKKGTYEVMLKVDDGWGLTDSRPVTLIVDARKISIELDVNEWLLKDVGLNDLISNKIDGDAIHNIINTGTVPALVEIGYAKEGDTIIKPGTEQGVDTFVTLLNETPIPTDGTLGIGVAEPDTEKPLAVPLTYGAPTELTEDTPGMSTTYKIRAYPVYVDK